MAPKEPELTPEEKRVKKEVGLTSVLEENEVI
jgi:hypothetical protein